MIDFINPRSQVVKMGSALTLLSIVVFAFGAYITVDKVTEYYTAKKIANLETLPSGDYLLGDTYGQQQDLTALATAAEEYEEMLAPETVTASTTSTTTPVVAGVQYTTEDTTTDSVATTQDNTTPAAPTPAAQEKTSQAIPQTNTIVIPRMGVDARIHEGATEATLSKGIWHMPQTATPDEGGNTVITAHRYLYRPPDPRTFFLIDKMQIGDEITVYWKGEAYTYRVRETKIVEPDEISILYNTPNDQLTLFSCTPLFTSDQRLVVIADRI